MKITAEMVAGFNIKGDFMDSKSFKAMVVQEDENGQFQRQIQEKTISQLPPGEVLVRVKYSSLNYKDGLSASGNRGVTKVYPHTPGIDCSGIVEVSESSSFQPGQKVIVTSYDLGMNTAGGFGEYVRVPADWVVPCPEQLSLRESMIFGTAGFTAAMSIFALYERVSPHQGPILVTGATGGVGCLAVAMLSKLGYQVTCVSGKKDAGKFLLQLGAEKVITRDEALKGSDRPILKTSWAGVVDTVGGDILATAIKASDLQGVVTCCGNVASPDLPLNVFPFILRGVSLVGIDSQNCPMEHRKKVWTLMAEDWKPAGLDELCREVELEQLDEEIDLILRGGQVGRVVVAL